MDSETKKDLDRGEWKRAIVGIGLMILPIVLFYFSGVGATIDCSKQHCQLVRKNFQTESRDTFSTTEILRIGYNSTGASYVRTGPSSIGVSGTDLEIHFKNGSSILVFGTPVGYQFGNLDFRELSTLISLPHDKDFKLQSYSYGGKLLFIGPTLVFIGYILVLIGMVRPVTPEIQPNQLQKNRIYNLVLFSVTLTIVIFLYYFLWNWGKSYLIS